MRYFIAVDERRMSKTVTLRDANQNFAKYVREVQAGEEIVITRRGEPVAKLLPVSRKRVLTPEGSIAARDHVGGTAPAQVRAAIGRARKRLPRRP